MTLLCACRAHAPLFLYAGGRENKNAKTKEEGGKPDADGGDGGDM